MIQLLIAFFVTLIVFTGVIEISRRIFINSNEVIPDEPFDVWDGSVGTLPTPIDNIYYISTGAELAAFRDKVNTDRNAAYYNVQLAANIDLADIGIVPIGVDVPYKGVFNGNGHTIKGVRILNSNTDTSIAGLFGSISNGMVSNLTVKGRIDGPH